MNWECGDRLFVYFKVPFSDFENAVYLSRKIAASLSGATGLAFRFDLSKRPETSDGKVTLMETYWLDTHNLTEVEAFKNVLSGQADLFIRTSGLNLERHVEHFIPIVEK